ncbi:hypothetical protein LINPERHAP2_LOCUS24927 [Linum perenne]
MDECAVQLLYLTILAPLLKFKTNTFSSSSSDSPPSRVRVSILYHQQMPNTLKRV